MPRQNDTGQPRHAPHAPHAPLRALVLAVACGWLLLVLSILVSPAVFASRSVDVSSNQAPGDICILATCTPTATNTPATMTDTPTATPATSPTGTATATPKVAPTATPTTAPSGGGGQGGGGGGGGQGGGGGGGPAGPNVTRVVFSQATVGASDSGPLQGLTPSTFGSNGLLLASTLSCVVALLGVIIGAIALLVLVRGGYGPFLKALLRGKRAGRRRGKQIEAGDAPGWNNEGPYQAPDMDYRGEAGYTPHGQGYNGYRSGFRGGYNDDYVPPPAQSASRQARSPAPNTRSRQNWR